MSRKLRISRPAENDLDEIWLYIAEDAPETADRFIDFVVERLTILSSSPEMGRLREDLEPGLRTFPLDNYLVFYRLSPDRVEIARIIHGARDIEALFE